MSEISSEKTEVGKIKVKMSATLAKEIVKAIENTDEQSIFVFDKHGLFIRVADPFHVRVVELLIEADTFDSYEFDSSLEQVRLGVVISRLKDITKTLVKKDMLQLEYHDGTNRIMTSSGSIQRSIRLIRSELMSDIPQIKVGHLYSLKLDSDILKPFLKAANTKGGMVDVITDNDVLLSCETDEGSVQITVEGEDAQLTPSDYVSMTTFSVGEIAKATSTATGVISVRGKQNGPIEMRWNTPVGSQMKCWVAPRL